MDLWVTPPRGLAGAELLDAGERDRLARFRFDRDRHLYCTAHALVRRVLGARVGRPPASLRFTTGRWGRPALPGGPSFNLSHTDGWVALAVSDHEVGVDVERDTERFDVLELAPSVFSPEERAALATLPEAHRRERFFRLWTLKEAYIKARGMGVALDLAGFTLRPDPWTVHFARGFADPHAAWSFVSCRVDDRTWGAVAVPADRVVVTRRPMP